MYWLNSCLLLPIKFLLLLCEETISEHFRCYNPNLRANVCSMHVTPRAPSGEKNTCHNQTVQGIVKFMHSPILHFALSSWIEKTMTKKIPCNWENRFFYNCMGLWGNFTAFSRVKKVGWCDIRRTVKQSLERIHRINDTKVLSIRPRLFSVFVCLIVFGFIYFCTQRLLGNPLLQMVWV